MTEDYMNCEAEAKWALTGSHSATCLSLMRLKPVLRIFPSDTNTALTGLEPS